MKIVTISITGKKKKILKPLFKVIEGCKSALREIAIQHRDAEERLWKHIRRLYPEIPTDDSLAHTKLTFSKFEITYEEMDDLDKQIEEKRLAKEKAIKDQDWETAAAFRNEERELRVKKSKAERLEKKL